MIPTPPRCGIFIFVLFFIVLQCQGLFQKKLIKMDRFDGVCRGFKNMTFQLQDIKLIQTRTNFLWSVKFVPLRDTSSDLKFKILIDRCTSRETLDSCEPYPDIVFSTVCPVFNNMMPPFRDALLKVEPKMVCPFKKGVYVMTNASVDQSTLAVLPIEGWYWKMHWNMYEKLDGEYKMICCTYAEGTIVNA